MTVRQLPPTEAMIDAAARAIDPGAYAPVANWQNLDESCRYMARKWKEQQVNSARSTAWVALVAAARVANGETASRKPSGNDCNNTESPDGRDPSPF